MYAVTISEHLSNSACSAANSESVFCGSADFIFSVSVAVETEIMPDPTKNWIPEIKSDSDISPLAHHSALFFTQDGIPSAVANGATDPTRNTGDCNYCCFD